MDINYKTFAIQCKEAYNSADSAFQKYLKENKPVIDLAEMVSSPIYSYLEPIDFSDSLNDCSKTIFESLNLANRIILKGSLDEIEERIEAVFIAYIQKTLPYFRLINTHLFGSLQELDLLYGFERETVPGEDYLVSIIADGLFYLNVLSVQKFLLATVIDAAHKRAPWSQWVVSEHQRVSPFNPYKKEIQIGLSVREYLEGRIFKKKEKEALKPLRIELLSGYLFQNFEPFGIGKASVAKLSRKEIKEWVREIVDSSS